MAKVQAKDARKRLDAAAAELVAAANAVAAVELKRLGEGNERARGVRRRVLSETIEKICRGQRFFDVGG